MPIDPNKLKSAFDQGLISEEMFQRAIPSDVVTPDPVVVPQTAAPVVEPARVEPVSTSTELPLEQPVTPAPAAEPAPAPVEPATPVSPTEALKESIRTQTESKSESQKEVARLKQERVIERQQQEAERDEELQRKQEDYERSLAVVDANVNRLKEMKPQTFWGSKSDSDRIMAGIALALGSMGSALAGGPNTAMQVIQGQMDDFRAKETAKYTQAKELINQSRLSADQKKKALEVSGQTWASRILGADEMLKQQIEAVMAKSKSTDILEKGKQMLAQIDINKDEREDAVKQVLQRDAFKSQLRREEAAGKPVKHSDANTKAAGFATRMKGASQAIKDLEAEGYDRTELSSGLGQTVPNLIMTDQGQRWAQAQEDWVSANLRRESGAVIGAEEMAREIKKYFPLAGDSKEVVEQKRKARERAEAGMIKSAGAAYEAPKEQAPKLSARDQQALDWANANPNDPRAKQIKDKLGVN